MRSQIVEIMDSPYKEDNTRDTETIICRSRPYDSGHPAFILFIMVGFTILVTVLSGELSAFVIATIFWSPIYLVVIDQLMWQIAGEETVSISNNYLHIRRKHTIFRRKGNIRLDNIREVRKWKPSLFLRLQMMPSYTGALQWTLCVTSNKVFPFKFAPRLSEEEQERVISEIEAAVKRAKEEMWEKV